MLHLLTLTGVRTTPHALLRAGTPLSTVSTHLQWQLNHFPPSLSSPPDDAAPSPQALDSNSHATRFSVRAVLDDDATQVARDGAVCALWTDPSCGELDPDLAAALPARDGVLTRDVSVVQFAEDESLVRVRVSFLPTLAGGVDAAEQFTVEAVECAGEALDVRVPLRVALHHGDCVGEPEGELGPTCVLAVRALEGVNLALPMKHKLARADVLISAGAVVDIQPCERLGAHFATAGEISPETIAELLLHLVDDDRDETHLDLVQLAKQQADPQHYPLPFLSPSIDSLLEYIKRDDDADYLLLKQQRAVLALADLLWEVRVECGELQTVLPIEDIAHTVSSQASTRDALLHVLTKTDAAAEHAYFIHANAFLRAANERELADFERCAHALLKSTDFENKSAAQLVNDSLVHVSQSGMRIAMSSANASDNWTSSKLRTGHVINMPVDIDGVVPLKSTLHILDEPVIVLSSMDSLSGSLMQRSQRFDASTDTLADAIDWSDSSDPFQMLKYALIFCNVLPEKGDAAAVRTRLEQFTGSPSRGFEFTLTNRGPSRSGFASSSAVAFNLLHVLFQCTGQTQIADDPVLLGSLVLLFEQRLGLKSGRQDVDGLLRGGLKQLVYHASSDDFLTPSITLLEDFPMHVLPSHYVLVDTGIQRSTHLDMRRGLNMRHWVLLSRTESGFPALRASYAIHADIVAALNAQDWPRLGKCFFDYMSMRERIDAGATASIYDDALDLPDLPGSVFPHRNRVLRYFFHSLFEAGLIYGGMLAGAMGGGVAMLVPSAHAVANPSALHAHLDTLRELSLGAAHPFAHLHHIQYTVDIHGVRYSTTSLS